MIREIIGNEDGFSIVEVIASIVLLGMLIPSAFYLFVFSNHIMTSNEHRSEAIQVGEDIRQLLDYRSQTQDIADLNRITLVDLNQQVKQINQDNKRLQLRREHVILDNTGIEYDQRNQPVYDEIPITTTNDIRGDFIRKVSYTGKEGLPEKLQNEENDRYMGTYLTFNQHTKEYEESDYLVRIDVLSQEEKIEEGLNLEVGVWDKQSGSKLNSTIVKWVVKY